ncbi:hypothetical protein D3C71_1805740 [compost metagenome]
MLACRDLVRARLVILDDHHVVFVDQVTIVHVDAEAAAGAADRIEHPAGIFGEIHVDRHVVALAPDARRCKLRHAARVLAERPLVVG